MLCRRLRYSECPESPSGRCCSRVGSYGTMIHVNPCRMRGTTCACVGGNNSACNVKPPVRNDIGAQQFLAARVRDLEVIVPVWQTSRALRRILAWTAIEIDIALRLILHVRVDDSAVNVGCEDSSGQWRSSMSRQHKNYH